MIADVPVGVRLANFSGTSKRRSWPSEPLHGLVRVDRLGSALNLRWVPLLRWAPIKKNLDRDIHGQRDGSRTQCQAVLRTVGMEGVFFPHRYPRTSLHEHSTARSSYASFFSFFPLEQKNEIVSILRVLVRVDRLGSALRYGCMDGLRPELKDLSQIRRFDKMLIVTTLVSFIKDNTCLSYLLW
jgi:hypothetical protein